jgi:hypothetical protein
MCCEGKIVVLIRGSGKEGSKGGERGREEGQARAREIGRDSVDGNSIGRSQRVGESTLLSRRGGTRKLLIPTVPYSTSRMAVLYTCALLSGCVCVFV